MSINKQSSVEKMFQEMLEIQQEGIKLTFDEHLDLLEKYKTMHKEEIAQAWKNGDGQFDNVAEQMSIDYYNETFNNQ